MEGRLKVTPQELIETATDFSARATDVKGITDEMLTKVSGLAGVFEGTSAEAYRTRFASLSDSMDTMHRQIEEHVSDLKKLASSYEQTESVNKTAVETLELPKLGV